MTHAHHSGAYNKCYMWGYINEYKTGKRIIWCMTDTNIHPSMFEAFECIIDDFGNLVKVNSK